jgi:superoxide dismutase, Fe-Mn family
MPTHHSSESVSLADSYLDKKDDSGDRTPRRRNFLRTSATLAAVLSGGGLYRNADAHRPASLPIAVDVGHSPLLEQPRLPFAENALAPAISASTLGFHYGKHHKAYFNNLAKLTAGSPLAGMSLEEVVVASSRTPELASVFDNAAQAWNHSFYWNSLSARAQQPSGRLREAIERDFGTLDGLLGELSKACVSQFGSGWGWLVLEVDKLKVVRTSNADLPFIHGQRPLLTIDVWEHAYYLDYQNRRADYVQAVLKRLLNWEFAERNFSRT